MTLLNGGNGHNNGNGAFYKWALGILTAILLAGGSWALVRITTLQEQAVRVDERVQTIGRRLDALDSGLEKLDSKLEDIQASQQRMTYLIVSKDNPELLRLMFPPAHP